MRACWMLMKGGVVGNVLPRSDLGFQRFWTVWWGMMAENNYSFAGTSLQGGWMMIKGTGVVMGTNTGGVLATGAMPWQAYQWAPLRTLGTTTQV